MSKYAVKKAISDLVSFENAFLGGTDKKPGYRVLNYHSITASLDKGDRYQMTTPKDLFARQMGLLRENGYSVLSCEEVVDRVIKGDPIPAKTVCITFDDGYKDNLTNALGILEKYSFKATIFLTTGYIGGGGDFLTWDEVKVLARSGLVSFGAHTIEHEKLLGADRGKLDREITLAKKVLEDELRSPVRLFAYPFGCYGSFDNAAEDLVKASGYKAAFTTIAGYNKPGSDLFRIKRTRISWCDDDKEFPKALTGAYDWYNLWQRLARTP